MLQHKGTQTIETERLLLRRFTEDDAEAVFANWMSDPETTKYLDVRREITPEAARGAAARWAEAGAAPDFYNWAVVPRGEREPIGHIEASVQSAYGEAGTVGYCIGRRFWNRGFATEALAAVLRFLLGEVGFRRLEGVYSQQNPASGRVLRKAGMTFEGVRRQGYRCRLGYQDAGVCSILRGEPVLPGASGGGRPGVTVREALPEDYGAVAALEEQVFSLHLRRRPDVFRAGYRLAREDYQKRLAAPDETLLLAEERGTGRAAGFCAVQRAEHTHPANNRFLTLHIDDLCVGEEFRRAGVGGALIGRVREMGERAGARNIELNVWLFNAQAVAFYEALGFAPRSQIMELALGGPSAPVSKAGGA